MQQKHITMTTNRVGFNSFLKNVVNDQKIDLIIDSNIIIAYFDEVHASKDLVKEFLDNLDNKANVTFYTTVNTKAEFLDYQRRRFLTNGIASLVYDKENFKIAKDVAAKIHNILTRRDGRLRREEDRNKNKDLEDFNSNLNYFGDREIKEIRNAFRARDIENEIGWLSICKTFLGSKLSEQENSLDEFCNYLTTRDQEQKENLFTVKEIDWKKATRISTQTGIGYSDAMILNMALSTKIQYIATLDSDMVYAGSVCAPNKIIILPDNKIKMFKKILKKIPLK